MWVENFIINYNISWGFVSYNRARVKVIFVKKKNRQFLNTTQAFTLPIIFNVSDKNNTKSLAFFDTTSHRYLRDLYKVI